MNLVNKYRGYILFLGYMYILCFTVWSFGRSFGPDGKSGFFLNMVFSFKIHLLLFCFLFNLFLLVILGFWEKFCPLFHF